MAPVDPHDVPGRLRIAAGDEPIEFVATRRRRRPVWTYVAELARLLTFPLRFRGLLFRAAVEAGSHVVRGARPRDPHVRAQRSRHGSFLSFVLLLTLAGLVILSSGIGSDPAVSRAIASSLFAASALLVIEWLWTILREATAYAGTPTRFLAYGERRIRHLHWTELEDASVENGRVILHRAQPPPGQPARIPLERVHDPAAMAAACRRLIDAARAPSRRGG